MDMSISTELLFCISLLNGGLCASLAKRRERRPAVWFAIGFAFGFIGFAVLAFLPRPKLKVAPSVRAAGAPSTAALKAVTPPPAEMAPVYNWYYITPEKETVGPLSTERFEELKALGVITDSTYVWNESMSEWKKLTLSN